MADKDGASRSGRRTRSQAAQEWSPVEELILVNEIAAVESDCKQELSSYQKWKIVAENCAAQDVSRTLSQLRRKCDALIDSFRRVYDYEGRSSTKVSFWSLDADRRETLRLPRRFSEELYAAVRSLVRARDNLPDSDPEDGAGVKSVVAGQVAEEIGANAVPSPDSRIYKHAKGSRMKRQRSSSQGKRSWKSLSEDNMSESSVETKPPPKSNEEEEKEKPPKSPSDKIPVKSSPEEIPSNNPAEEEPQQGSNENPPQTDNVEDEVVVDMEAKERMIAKTLRENSKRIISIVAESTGSEDDQTKSTELVSRQGKEIISSLAEIVKTLEQLCAQEF